MNAINAVSPIDGRYQGKTQPLSEYFSEKALIQYRVRVEIEYFLALSKELPQLGQLISSDKIDAIRAIYTNFTQADAISVKEIEATTNHDVKAVEYFIKSKFDEIGGLEAAKEFVHFGLTSQDINNTSFPLMTKEAIENVYLPALMKVLSKMDEYSDEWKDIPMLAKTHGQPASPTRLGKEFRVFSYRIKEQLTQLDSIKHSAKFGGATGNFNAHKIAYPDHDWIHFANQFVENSLGLVREAYTTQISNYDNAAALYDCIARINTILIDFSRDIWMYISMDYFKQKIKAGEVGSSAMPHKVNPIDFENAEGNLGMSNAIFRFLSMKLPISRLQRDLTDSTVIRNIGVPLAHSLIALASLEKGLGKLLLNRDTLEKDLQRNYAVVAEAIQTILRREGYPKPYEKLKELTRTNEAITAESISNFVETLDVSDAIKEELRQITPMNYLGY